MKGRAFKGAVLIFISLTVSSIWFFFYRPAAIIRTLDEQISALTKMSHRYDKGEDKLIALKFAQIAHIVGGTKQEELTRLEKLQFIIDTQDSSTYADHIRAENIVAEEMRALGEPLLTQLTLVLEGGQCDRGMACVGLRVLGNVSRERVTNCTSNLVKEGKNDLLTREAVILALINEQTELEKDIVNLVWKWQGWGRQYPIHVLRRMKTKIGEEAIIAALDDSSPAVRRHATRALGEIGGGKSLAPLRALLEDEKDKIVRLLAQKAIAHIEKQLPPLEKSNQR